MSDPRDWPEDMKMAAVEAQKTVRAIETHGARAALLDLAKWCRERRGECSLDPDLCVQCGVWDEAAAEAERRARALK